MLFSIWTIRSGTGSCLKTRDVASEYRRDTEDVGRAGDTPCVASKNPNDLAWQKLEQFGLQEYFLYPAINWVPKSQNIKNIADQLNIGLDTFVFVDNSYLSGKKSRRRYRWSRLWIRHRSWRTCWNMAACVAATAASAKPPPLIQRVGVS